MRVHKLYLVPSARAELEWMRDHSPLPYLRERSAAVLKVADGEPAARVARTGLLRPRNPDTVREWLKRVEKGGVDGLRIREGRGRKPAFPPSASRSRGEGGDRLHRALRPA